MNGATPPLLVVSAPSLDRVHLRSDRMLNELLALNEEMVVQLRLERLSTVGTTDFIASMIDQHEKAASRLRMQLKRHEASHPQGRGAVHPISLSNPQTG
jgi:hypothetical protein